MALGAAMVRAQSLGSHRELSRGNPARGSTSIALVGSGFDRLRLGRAFGGWAPMTTENVAILFTDIVGSTELSQRLSPEAADEVRRSHFSLLRQALTESGGTEVKNLGDGLMAVFTSPSSALSCGVVMQQLVDRDNRGREFPVGLRVGLSGGEVSREADDYFGDPVVEAARLCALCESGKVLATDLVRGMAGRRSRYSFQPIGELKLKGLSAPIDTVEVLWEPFGDPSTAEAVPLPSRLSVRATFGVFGRELEIGALQDATKRVAEGQGREVVLISGEAGLGKTTLMAEAARKAFDSGAYVLFGHCEEDVASPYQLFAEALGHYVDHASEGQLRAHLETHGSELASLVPSLRTGIPGLPASRAQDSDTERYLLFGAVIGSLALMSQDRPVVLVFDDLQWADKGSLLLLRQLAASDLPMRVLILGTYRDSELGRSHGLLEALAGLYRQQGVSRIELTGLDDTGVVELMESAAGYPLDEDGIELAHALYRETDGNPFFVTEVLRHLSETGDIYQDATGHWIANGALDQAALPPSVRVVVAARVGRLGPEAGRALSMAAVIGRDFDLELLCLATRVPQDELIDVLEDAAAAALVRELADSPGRYSFVHALIQHTLYVDLGATRRARAHRIIAESLEEQCGDHPGTRAGELARHWYSATQPVDRDKAINYSRQAADVALQALAPADALQYYAQALDLYEQADDPDPVLGVDLAIGLGTAQRQTGNPGFRSVLLDAAQLAADLGDIDRLVAAVLANDRGFTSTIGGVDVERVKALEMTLDRLPDDHPERALVLANLCSELTFGSSLDRRQALADAALELAYNSGDDATIVRVQNHLFDPLMVPSLLEERMVASTDALIRAERIGDPFLLYFAAHYASNTAVSAGNIDEADRCLTIMRSMADQLDQPSIRWLFTFAAGGRAIVAGETDRAEQLATEALKVGTDGGEADALILFGAQFLALSVQRGSMSDVIPFIEQTVVDRPGLPLFTATLATAYADAGRIDDARDLLEKFAGAGFELPMDLLWLLGMFAYAAAAIECGDRRYAEPLHECLLPLTDQFTTAGGSTAQGPLSYYLGGLSAVLGQFDEADARFAQSASLAERMGARYFAVRTDVEWGKMLVRRGAPGDAEKAIGLLGDAQAKAAAHGYRTLERRAASALDEFQ
jgi:class 3 adenylate cyclase/tetratricopeptide (TPR) repeat protein